MFDNIGHPFFDDDRQVRRVTVGQAGSPGEVSGQHQSFGDRPFIGRRQRTSLDFGFGGGGKLSYVSSPMQLEADVRRTLVSVLLVTASLALGGAAAAADIGRIKSVTGTVSVVRGAATTPAVTGQALQVSDVLKTGADGRIGITFVDNSRFAVGPNSNIALSQFEFDDTTHAGKSLTTVNRGALAIVSGQIAKENKDAMRVRTPTSLLAARGTRFVVEVAE